MQEQSRYIVGIDVGTRNVRCVVGYSDDMGGSPKIIGVGSVKNTGMRKGVVTNLSGPAAAIDSVLEIVEKMSGHQVHGAILSANGSHIVSTKADGMITVGAVNNEVTSEDVARIEDVATTGKVPQNRDILDIVAHSYKLDGQDNIKDPVGMNGARLEIKANIVSGLSPHIANIQKSAEMAKVETLAVVPAVLASAQAVLNENQKENGVAVVDIGAATTGVAVFEDGDLQYLSVIPLGGQNVTNDLAIGLKTDPEIAEAVKLAHARFSGDNLGIVDTKYDKKTYQFDQSEIDEIIEARYEEIFEAVAKELKKAGRLGKLPSGVILVGGGSNVKNLADFAKDHLLVAARIGSPTVHAGASEDLKKPEFAAAVGLIMADSLNVSRGNEYKANSVKQKTDGLLKKLFSKFS